MSLQNDEMILAVSHLSQEMYFNWRGKFVVNSPPKSPSGGGLLKIM
jgi:hypothetical protein